MSVSGPKFEVVGGNMFRNFIDWLLGRRRIVRRQFVDEWRPPRTKPTEMDQGDYHSGPHGYTPNTAYPETQYGSSFDEDAAWNDEGDWR